MGHRIPLSEPTLGAAELANLSACVEEQWVARGGRFVREFEALFADIVGVPEAVSTVTGSAALHLAMVDLGIGPGDEVIVPALTFFATAAPVRQVGAVPVFVDVDPTTYCLDPAAADAAITPRTRAILPVHLYGHPVDMDELAQIAEPRALPLVEDATEALGSEVRGRPCGTLGAIGAFSFNGNKVITAGGGGMLVAQEPARLQHLRHLTLQSRVPGTIEYLHDELGFNYALSNLHAAVGLAQLQRLDELVDARRSLAARYAAALEDVEDLTFCHEASWAHSNFWLMSVLVDEEVAGRTKAALLRSLNEAGVEARPFFAPLNGIEAFADLPSTATPVADGLHRRGICIPSSAGLRHEDQDRVIEILRA
jgi:perosamine synthetase